MELKNYRKQYGKFRLKTYFFQLLGMFLSSLLALFVLIYYSKYFGVSIVIWIYDICWLSMMILPYLRCYYIDFPNIYIKSINKEYKIEIPKDYSVIISSMELRQPLSVQGNCTDNYCVSIIGSNNLIEITGLLHRNFVKRYTNASIKNCFGQLFITEFLYDNSVSSELLQNASYVIVPKTVNKYLKLTAPNIICDFDH